jgi:hypothetical protein
MADQELLGCGVARGPGCAPHAAADLGHSLGWQLGRVGALAVAQRQERQTADRCLPGFLGADKMPWGKARRD